MTTIEHETIVPVEEGAMRTLIIAPHARGRFPALVLYSDIFALTPSTRRMIARFAGHGFVVAAPEIYHRLERAGEAFAFDDAGRERGLANAAKTSVASWDSDLAALIAFLRTRDDVEAKTLGAIGFCLGGHLAFRAALHPEIRAAACFYPTGVESGRLGSEPDCGTLGRALEIDGRVLLVFGTRDPHVSFEGRETIVHALHEAGVDIRLLEYDAEHAFMRDEGPRYDPAASDAAFLEAIDFFRAAFS